MRIRLVISGRGYDAAATIPEHLTLGEGASVDEALAAVAKLIPGEKQLAASSLVAVSGNHLGTLQNHRPQVLQDGDELVVITPVAGG